MQGSVEETRVKVEELTNSWKEWVKKFIDELMRKKYLKNNEKFSEKVFENIAAIGDHNAVQEYVLPILNKARNTTKVLAKWSKEWDKLQKELEIFNEIIRNQIKEEIMQRKPETSTKLKLKFSEEEVNRVANLTSKDVLNDKYVPPEGTKVILHNLDLLKALAKGKILKSATYTGPSEECTKNLIAIMEEAKKYKNDALILKQYKDPKSYPIDRNTLETGREYVLQCIESIKST